MNENIDSAGSTSLTPTESVVSAIWADLLQQSVIEPNDNFFDQGGDSLMAMIVQFRVAEELQVELYPGALNEAPTLRQFCGLIDRLRVEAECSDVLESAAVAQSGTL